MCQKAGRKRCGAASCEGCEFLRPRILPENEEIIRIWCEVRTCWRYGVMGGRIGLDYSQVQTIATWCDIDMRTPRIRNGLMFLEGLELERTAK